MSKQVDYSFTEHGPATRGTVSSVQLLSRVQLIVTPWTAARQASLSITNSQSLLKCMSIVLVMPSNHLILYYPLLLLPSVFASIRVFSNESVLCIRWSKYWSFSFSISSCHEYSGLISFRVNWLDLLAVQGTSGKVQVVLVVKNLPAKAGDARDAGLISGSGRSPGSRKWQTTPVFLPGKFHGQKSLVGCRPWGHKESDTTEHNSKHTH